MSVITTERTHRGQGYQQCWYPLMLSENLEEGNIAGHDFCGGRVILYRDSGGTPRAMTAYCKHLGADLSVGDVVGDDVRCAFHHWQYGPDGVCTTIPTGDRIPPQARQVSFPTEEKWGIIWVFFGTEPLYPVPSFHESVDIDRIMYRAFEYDESAQVDPWWVFTTNVFDFNHLGIVHGIEGLEEWGETVELEVEDYRIGYAGGAVRVWGVNADVTTGERPGTAMIGAGTPTGTTTKHFMIEAASIGDGTDKEVAEAEATIADLQKTHQYIIEVEDRPIIDTLNFYEGGLLVGADRALGRFLRYAQKYPRTTMAELAG